MAEPQVRGAGDGMVVVAFEVLCLLGWGAVIGEAVGLDDEVEGRKVKVDFVAVDVDGGAWERQTGVAGERKEGALQFGARVAEGTSVEDLPKPSNTALAVVVIERFAESIRADEPESVCLVDRPLEDSLVVPGGEVDEVCTGEATGMPSQ
jgi:hypothetical protein